MSLALARRTLRSPLARRLVFLPVLVAICVGLAGPSPASALPAAQSAPTFADVPLDHPYYDEIEALYQAGYTAGCSSDPLMYCPETTMNRAESAVFVERGIHTASYVPPQPASQVFADVPLDSWSVGWVSGLWDDKYTAGCGANPLLYCPWQGHTRAEGAVFYLRMLNGASFEPPQPSQQAFSDVGLETWYAKWVQAAYDAGLIKACGTGPLRFCPNDPLTRGLAAYMMAQAKRLTPGFRTVDYQPTTDLFPNPERGFYHHTETHSDHYTPLVLDTLRRFRQNENITLILRVFYLEDFVNTEISDMYLTAMQADFGRVREAGLKIIVRFAYTDQMQSVPPYGDASKPQILRHLAQLKTILQENGDVIAAVQAGFIGTWGEWYYTDHCIQDPRDPGNVTSEDYACRFEILGAILDAVPEDRMVQLRTPRYKVNTVPESANYSPIPAAEAYSGTVPARVGYHNDCFLAGESDYGTYLAPTVEYPYLEAETRYLPMGGETCNDTTQDNPPSDRSQCPTALKELAMFHWSYLNIDYHPDVLSSWATSVPPHDCLPEVKSRLGYRFALVKGSYANEVKPGDGFAIDVRLRNEGWAAPFNPRPVELVLWHKPNDVYKVALPDAPRSWLADDTETYSLAHTICTPADMPLGDYELLLYLPDREPSLYLRPEYAIRLANEAVWDDGTGYNYLLHTIRVSNTAPSSVCDSSLLLSDEAHLNR